MGLTFLHDTLDLKDLSCPQQVYDYQYILMLPNNVIYTPQFLPIRKSSTQQLDVEGYYLEILIVFYLGYSHGLPHFLVLYLLYNPIN